MTSAASSPHDTEPVLLDPDALTFAQVVAVARHDARVLIPDPVAERVRDSRRAVEALATSQTPVYGVSTGFGALAQRHIPAESRATLQKSLIRSHAAGLGEPVEREVDSLTERWVDSVVDMVVRSPTDSLKPICAVALTAFRALAAIWAEICAPERIFSDSRRSSPSEFCSSMSASLIEASAAFKKASTWAEWSRERSSICAPSALSTAS